MPLFVLEYPLPNPLCLLNSVIDVFFDVLHPLVSGFVSHMTFSLENFLVIGSACCNSTILDIAYLKIGIHFPMNSSCNLLYCHNSVCCSYRHSNFIVCMNVC